MSSIRRRRGLPENLKACRTTKVDIAIRVALALFALFFLSLFPSEIGRFAIYLILFLAFLWWAPFSLKSLFRWPSTGEWLKAARLFIPFILLHAGLATVTFLILSYISPSAVEWMLRFGIEMEAKYREPSAFWWLGPIVVGPFIEELVFRAWMFGALSLSLGPIAAAWISSSLFSLLHFPELLGTLIFSLLLCLIYFRTKSLWIPFGFHLLNNGLVIAYMRFSSEPEEGVDLLQEFQNLWWLYILSLTVGLILTVYLIKRDWGGFKMQNEISRPSDPEEGQSGLE